MQLALRDHVITVELPRWRGRRPIQGRWLCLLTLAFGLGLAAGASVVLEARLAADQPTSPRTILRVTSTPSGAEILIDGHSRGRTPAHLPLAIGTHQITLRKEGYLDRIISVTLRKSHATTIDATLWLATPRVTLLRPVLPGATLADASFLQDGRVTLTLALPNATREVWSIDAHGIPHRVGPAEPRAGEVVAPDGQRVAYLVAGPSGRGTAASFASALTELWVTRANQGSADKWYAVPSSDRGLKLLGASWAPKGNGLLLVVQQTVASDGRDTTGSRLVWVSAMPPDHPSRLLLRLPAVIQPDSIVWSPRGDQVAFLAHSKQDTALCLIHLDGSDFRDLAHESQSRTGANLPAPLSWSADERRVAYTATMPGTTTGSWPFGSSPRDQLIIEDATRRDPMVLTTINGMTPIWWGADGTLAMLVSNGRAGNLALETLASDGQTRVLGTVPLHARGPVAVRWDLAHAQAIVATQASRGIEAPLVQEPPLEFWLVRWRPVEVR